MFLLSAKLHHDPKVWTCFQGGLFFTIFLKAAESIHSHKIQTIQQGITWGVKLRKRQMLTGCGATLRKKCYNDVDSLHPVSF